MVSTDLGWPFKYNEHDELSPRCIDCSDDKDRSCTTILEINSDGPQTKSYTIQGCIGKKLNYNEVTKQFIVTKEPCQFYKRKWWKFWAA